MKEKLEENFSETNKVIKEGERLNKIIKTYRKEEGEKNTIKLLSYVSYIHNRKKDMEELFFKLMKNIKISYIDKDLEEYIKFEYYYFNGIKYPKDIEFKDISIDNINVDWKFDKINFINLDEKKIKYKIEIREDNQNEEFKSVYEGNNTSCLIENLKINTSYEIRICSIYNNFISAYTPIQKIKTSAIDGNILKDSKRYAEFINILSQWTGYKKMELIYRGTRDGTKSQNFHEKCDNQGPSICLYKNEKVNCFSLHKIHRPFQTFLLYEIKIYN